MSSNFELNGRPTGRANSRGGRGRGGGNFPRAAGSQSGRPVQQQVAYGRDPADDDMLQGQQAGGRFPPPITFPAQRSHHHQSSSSSSNRGNSGSRRGKMTSSHNNTHFQVSGNQADDNGEMNAHLSERLVATSRPRDRATASYSSVPRNPLVEHYERALPFSTDDEVPSAWRLLPEVPSTEELMTDVVDLPINEVEHPWESIDDYLGAHYELLREDSFSPLRDAVGRFRKEPTMDDEHQICVYESCRIVGVTFAYSGICVKMSFSTNRARKRIAWENSKRLCPGTLVALTTDNFQSVVRVATVAARPISGLEGDLPYGTVVDLLLHPDELELDPTKTWIMVESRSGYFEAFKHTLRALQRMDGNFPFNKILTLQDTAVGTPQFLKEKPGLNLAPCFNDSDSAALQNVNILKGFPKKSQVTTSMDEFQLEAVERILTKELAIVQGPPGCGKTFVSTKSIAAMVANSKPKDPPIIIACQTNHALDQLLRHVIEFESRVIRLGGRTQDTGVIRERTLFNVRQQVGNVIVQGSGIHRCRSKFKSLEKRARGLLECLSERNLTPDNLLLYNIITQTQRDKFHKRVDQWVKLSVGNKESAISPMIAWIGDALRPRPRREVMACDIEDEDIGVEELKDLEAEFNDEWDGKLYGTFVEFERKMQVITRPAVTKETVLGYMKKDDLWDIPEPVRGDVYAHLENLYITAIEEEMRKINKEYAQNVTEYKIAKWEADAHILEKARVIGLTTTGVSKYRSLVAALQPRICLIEEAAETLEGPLIAACYPSIQQLVLVGDHKQLKGHCNVMELDKPPYNLSVSMFERLVNNGIEYSGLKKQRRMRPEIRRILMPIYEDLEDDSQVFNMKPVPGMGNTNLFFFAHEVPEEQDELSKKNSHEAQMIVGFCQYLVENGIARKEITILTFYTGQARELRRLLSRNEKLNKGAIGKDRIRVATVDSFQGEENEVVILSLCRSNAQLNIGFLNVPNRVCVSISRAKRGFYMFGNANLLSQTSGLWWDILQIMNERNPPAIGTMLPVTCQRHKNITQMQYVADWHEIDGGCKNPCGESLDCGHRCTLMCHPYEHNRVCCAEPCRKSLPCGHPCSNKCFQACSVGKCGYCNHTPNQGQYSTYNPNSHMDRLADQLGGARATDSNQPARAPPPAHYQNPSSSNTMGRPLGQFPTPQTASSQAVRGPPPAQYQNPHFNKPVERLSEPFPNTQTAKSSQTVRGPPPSHYQNPSSSNTMGRPLEQFPTPQAASSQAVRGPPPAQYQNPHFNKPVERLSEPFPNIQTAKSSQTVRGPPPSHYQSSIPNKAMERHSEPVPIFQTTNTNPMARGPPPNNYQARQSSKRVEELSERLAEVKTTDMIPTVLNPTSPGKKSSPSKAPRRVREAITPLISWDNVPPQPTTSVPSFSTLGWDGDVMQPTIPKRQKEPAPIPSAPAKTIPDPKSPSKKEPEMLLIDFDADVFEPLPPDKNNEILLAAPIDNTADIVSAVPNKEQKQEEIKSQSPVDDKVLSTSTEKAKLEESPTSSGRRHESSEDYNLDQLKEFVHKQSRERLKLAGKNSDGAIASLQKDEVSKKAKDQGSSVAKKADTNLISFDDEPVTKTLASGGSGIVPFTDMNKVLLTTETQAYISTDKKKGGLVDEKKGNEAPSEKRGFSELDLLLDF
ncbi:hypothetical protein TWF481_007598 [Arthrobotrys musiformis]|uniref:Uncharacterized protein n=1 Tax=Arthrobotrys musiformis TaxID=47236 RepID=A0AAV9WDS1_9PEZI